MTGEVEYADGLNSISWDKNMRDKFQTKLNESNQYVICGVGWVSE